eukprot:806441-Amphidinium_carterae.1
MAARGSAPRATLIDAKGLGRPSTFSGGDGFTSWSLKTRNYIIGVMPQLARPLDWEAESITAITEDKLRAVFGPQADEDDRAAWMGSNIWTGKTFAKWQQC